MGCWKYARLAQHCLHARCMGEWEREVAAAPSNHCCSTYHVADLSVFLYFVQYHTICSLPGWMMLDGGSKALRGNAVTGISCWFQMTWSDCVKRQQQARTLTGRWQCIRPNRSSKRRPIRLSQCAFKKNISIFILQVCGSLLFLTQLLSISTRGTEEEGYSVDRVADWWALQKDFVLPSLAKLDKHHWGERNLGRFVQTLHGLSYLHWRGARASAQRTRLIWTKQEKIEEENIV